MIKIITQDKKSNPTDHNLILKLTVKKSFPDYGTMYEVYLGRKRIGFADIDNGKTEISFVQINKEYQRKGVSTFLYNYIEKDLGCKLKPSKDLIEDGEAFWKNRSKRINPVDKEFLNRLEVEKFKLSNQDDMYRYNLNYYYDPDFKVYVGGAFVDLDNQYVLKVEIHPSFRRKGAASFLYDHIEKDLGIKLKSSGTLRPDGEKFWENRLKKNPLFKPKPRKTK